MTNYWWSPLENLTHFKINKILFIDLLITLKYIGIYIKKVREEERGMGDREKG